MPEARHDGRRADELRSLRIERGFVGAAPGSVLIAAGRTAVLCTASIDDVLPEWMKSQDRGWITGEYNMLPGSTRPRKVRERSRIDGRTTEIQRLVGRSLRTAVDLRALGPRTITLDCDVLEADGGTRTLSITGAWIALVDAVRQLPPAASPIVVRQVAAVSVGIVGAESWLDLNYSEDVRADVDMNVVMALDGPGANLAAGFPDPQASATALGFVELQGTAEKTPWGGRDLPPLLSLAEQGIRTLMAAQQAALAGR